MLKSDVQHQFWVTKKTVQRKFGQKEDECIINSDSELDTKIELFNSIVKSTNSLFRVVDNYQERLCCLATEENQLGRFLKENGKQSSTSSKVMVFAGKAISYCGQQRMTLRPSVIRLYNEVETFRTRAIRDTKETIEAMERERTNYRASLSWMKSVSAQLDPDSDKGLEKFRKAQNQVRLSKQKFDRLSLDCLEKIDLLAAARCNMFSHVLISYQAAMLNFATKTLETLKVASKVLQCEPNYTFSILFQDKPLEANPAESKKEPVEEVPAGNLDPDQMLFFQEDFKEDNKNETESQAKSPEKASEAEVLLNIESNENKGNEQNVESKPTPSTSLLDGVDELDEFILKSNNASYMPSQLLLNMDFNFLNTEEPSVEPTNADNKSIIDLFPSQSSKSLLNPMSLLPNRKADTSKPKESPTLSANASKSKSGKDMSTWFQLFSELDPLANPDAFAKQLEGHSNSSHSA